MICEHLVVKVPGLGTVRVKIPALSLQSPQGQGRGTRENCCDRGGAGAPSFLRVLCEGGWGI
ncbi:hypothetical protein SBA1_630003 [Candidatus Sulfotelmatobacter kueseliae]|uniref:Uncharacterized protein n=1 Tax=Candidatus Sulfotelmatobacter kueseliae TaxID=2042962 RepID=A0A2U3L299_9BACT|nr:hypothetical protein SBA1_630003 [Candidatus Sulfotelmatobacter kueseliae]